MNKEEQSLDTMKEIINIGMGESADALSGLVGTRVIINVPNVHIMDIVRVFPYIQEEMASIGVYIAQDFKGLISGKTILCYTHECCISLLKNIYGDSMQVTSITDTGISTLNEIGNIIMVSYISAISNFIEGRVRFDLPEVTVEISEKYFENLICDLKTFGKAIVVKNTMSIKEKDIEGYLFVLLSFKDFRRVVETLENKLNRR